MGDLAGGLGANVYYTRLAGHAQDGEALADVSADDWLADAAEAVAVGAAASARAARWSQVRALFPPGLTFTGLSVVASTIHVGVFNPERWVTWLFFGLYGAVFLAGLAAYVRYEWTPGTPSVAPARAGVDGPEPSARAATA